MPLLTLRPTAAGSSTFCTPVGAAQNWDCVNDITSDGDSTYVESATLATEEFYNITDITGLIGPADIIGGINIVFTGRRTGFAIDVKSKIKNGANTYNDAQTSIAATYTTYTMFVLPINPTTGIGWTVAEINALQIGFEIVGAVTSNFRLTQIYLEVVYTSSSPASALIISD